MRLFVIGLSLAGPVVVLSSAQAGLRIVTRDSASYGTVEQIDYVLPDRARTESRITPAPSHSDAGGNDRVEEHGNAIIRRCDLNRVIALNYQDRTYETSPLRRQPTVFDSLFGFIRARRAPESNAPDLTIETTTVQTGERRRDFGYIARRVITTGRYRRSVENVGAASEVERDGWYIDLEDQPSCERLGRFRAVLIASTQSAGGRRDAYPQVVFRDIGAPETGFAVELKTTFRTAGATPSGVTAPSRHVIQRRVLHLSRETLDPSLFEVPQGFHAGHGRLATLASEWMRTWWTLTEVLRAAF